MLQTRRNIKSCSNVIPFESQYFSITAVDGDVSVACEDGITTSWSYDMKTWTEGSSVVIPSGKKMYFGQLLGYAAADIGSLSITGDFIAAGNILSLAHGEDFLLNNTITACKNLFRGFFQGRNIIDASNLVLSPTRVYANSYAMMFRNCEKLLYPPKLPATTLANYCYENMFNGCVKLKEAPDLPATRLYQSSYSGMFYGCESIVTPPTISATTLGSACCQNMFNSCTSLESTPVLKSKTATYACYFSMFQNCSSLKNITELPATKVNFSSYNYMFSNCTSLVKSLEKLPATVLAENCYAYMFSGCTSLLQAPLLIATTSAPNCYQGMFYGCSKLNNLDIRLQYISDDSDSLSNILYGASVEGVLYKDRSSLLVPGLNIPSDWIVVNYDNTDDSGWSVSLGNDWRISSAVANPNSSIYSGVYESYSNIGVDDSAAVMYIYIYGLTNFELYIRSYAENDYDYVMVSQLDVDIDKDTSYNSDLIKAYTRGQSNDVTSIGGYTYVGFSDITAGMHRITVLYKKDVSASYNDDKGYVLIPKLQ